MEGTLYDWAQEAVSALELPHEAQWVGEKETVQWVLDFAREVAQGVARPGAPVGAFLAGVAVGRDPARGRQALEDVRAALEPTMTGERAPD